VPRTLVAHSPEKVCDGVSPRREEGAKQQNEEPAVGGLRQYRLKSTE
jgi:hypothetical protein